MESEMSIVARGMLITEAYRDYKSGKFLVNRGYQRKLVWTIDEKRYLIDSIIKNYPIPLVLLAHTKDDKYEVIDGMQRLDAIFSFIDNKYSLEDGSYFDINEFQTSKMYHENLDDNRKLLSPTSCANITEYQLAVTIFPVEDDTPVTDIFGRINSGGRQLSDQEKRQAGVNSSFSNFIRKLSSILRRDVTDDLIELSKMPSISIDGVQKSDKQGYGINAEDTFWVYQGIINSKDLRDSLDEQILADLSMSILEGQPFASSKEALNDIYTEGEKKYENSNRLLLSYPAVQLEKEIITIISAIQDVLQSINPDKNTFRNLVIKGSASSSRTPFYAVFMAFHQLIVKENKKPHDYSKIYDTLTNLNSKLSGAKHYTNVEERTKNINITYGLIKGGFVDSSPSLVGHGQGLIMDFEAAINRSKAESSRYEMKQGILHVEQQKKINKKLLKKITEIICSMANIGPLSTGGNIFIGVADSDSDSSRISSTYGVNPALLGNKYIFGVDHELNKLDYDLDQYMDLIVNDIKNSALSEPLKSDVLTNIDHFEYKGKTVIWIKVPVQKEMSWIGDKSYHREGSSTVEASSKQVIAINSRFSR